MKLSSLLRKGATKIQASGHKQLFGGLADGQGNACALGAIYVGFGIEASEVATSPMREPAENLLFSDVGALDVILDGRMNAQSAIVHLNDQRRWNFEAIADFLESKGL